MLFNSVEFFIFFPIVFVCYWILLAKKLKSQNTFLLIASYFFYSFWDYRFLGLLLFSTLLDYFVAQKIDSSPNKSTKKTLLYASIVINLGFLGFFKYCNFFIDSFAVFLSNFGFKPHFWTLQIILPVGISFYTFHGLSYIIDVYKERIKPERSFIDYGLFVSFFPLLVAGPIERATHLLPQIKRGRHFNYSRAMDGLRQILWGLFKKVVVADNCAKYANIIFNPSEEFSGSTLALGALFFTFQIYCDFSGYSDIALGTARILGFDLLKNFSFPYFSRDIAEFWRKWHISLSSWFRDYVYIPLGGSRVSKLKQIRNVFIIFILSGFWHGANWTFIVWGFLHAIYFLPLMLLGKNRNHLTVSEPKIVPSLRGFINILFTFGLVVFAWIFFRADNLSHAFNYISGIFSSSFFAIPAYFPKKVFAFIAVLLLIEWWGRSDNHALEKFSLSWPKPVRILFYYCLLFMIFYFSGEEQQFIYFQF